MWPLVWDCWGRKAFRCSCWIWLKSPGLPIGVRHVPGGLDRLVRDIAIFKCQADVGGWVEVEPKQNSKNI